MMKTRNYVVLAVIVPILVFALVLTAITGGPAATAAPAVAVPPEPTVLPASGQR